MTAKWINYRSDVIEGNAKVSQLTAMFDLIS